MNSEKSNNKVTGNLGEEIAGKFLDKLGYEIIDRNYRIGRGEIDIVAKDGNVLVFIEVKTRKGLDKGLPIEAVTQAKISQLRKLAERYLYEKNISDTDCRFDVIGIELTDDKPVIEHYINAF